MKPKLSNKMSAPPNERNYALYCVLSLTLRCLAQTAEIAVDPLGVARGQSETMRVGVPERLITMPSCTDRTR